MRPDGEVAADTSTPASVEVPQEFADLAEMLAAARENAGRKKVPVATEVMAVRHRPRRRRENYRAR